uniref:Uncharacterized protein n=1 Tax=Anopheles farauti TaxID=69004 RepID=A0A182QYG2_9DIPT
MCFRALSGCCEAFLAVLLAIGTSGIVVPWRSCPVIALEDWSDYDCDLMGPAWRLEPLAHIPGGSNSMNLFHNPYERLNCVHFYFYCRKERSILGDLYIVPTHMSSLVCPGYSIFLEDGIWQLQIFTNPWSKMCKTVDRWLSMDMFTFRQDEYIFTYGCRERSENQPIVIGAWILVDANATAEQRKRVIEDARQIALNIPGFRNEWWVYPNAADQCTDINATCNYLANCMAGADAPVLHATSLVSSSSLYIVLGTIVFVLVLFFCRKVMENLHRNKVTPAQDDR